MGIEARLTKLERWLDPDPPLPQPAPSWVLGWDYGDGILRQEDDPAAPPVDVAGLPAGAVVIRVTYDDPPSGRCT